jgi:beta-lactam-binding protein with PASTA domain
VTGARPAVPQPRRQPREPQQSPPPLGPKGTQRFPAAAPPAKAPPRANPQAPPPSATISLRLPGDDAGADAGPVAVAVAPGDRVRVLADVRNQGGIVDNYSLVVHGLPDDWYSVMPETVYLVPLGSRGAYEQEIEIHFHPPRDPNAEARRWELRIGVWSHAAEVEIASAPMTLGIRPYEDYTVRVRPERATGRRRAKYDVTIVNNANGVAMLALDGQDDESACLFDFQRDTVELGAGESKVVKMTCKPPRKIWVGRALDRTLEISTATGEAGEKLLQDKAEAKLRFAESKGIKNRLKKLPIPGLSKPNMGVPQIGIGPGGKISVQRPMARGPQFRGVNLRPPTMGLKALKMPGQQAAPEAPAAPLLPTQAVFRQKPIIPWWLAIVAALLLALLILLIMLWPKPVKQVSVPKLVGKPTSFAQNKLDDVKLTLGSQTVKPTDLEDPGVILEQHPQAGAKRDVQSKVNIVVAVGTGNAVVPNLVGLTLSPATSKLLDAKLTKGAITPVNASPTAKITSTIPEAGKTVKEGQPVDIYYIKPKGKGKPGKKPGTPGTPGGPTAAGGPVTIPKIDPKDEQGYAKVLGQLGLAPRSRPSVSDAKAGTVLATVPEVGSKVEAGTEVTMLVAAGFPSMVFDNDDNVKRVTGSGGFLPAIAKSPDAREKDPTWAPDGYHVVYTSNGQLTVVDVRDIDQDRAKDPVTLTSGDAKYRDPIFAPTGTDPAAPVKRDPVLAVVRAGATDADLCFARLKNNGFQPRCLADDKLTIAAPHWVPGGKQIVVPASTDGESWGVRLYESDKPYSADPDEWKDKGFVTDPSKRFIMDLGVSPDKKWLAAAANIHGDSFSLYLTQDPFENIKLTKVDPLPINACKVTWIDNTHLAIVKFGPSCDQTTGAGEIARISVGNPKKQTTIVDNGDNPSFRPLPGG